MIGAGVAEGMEMVPSYAALCIADLHHQRGEEWVCQRCVKFMSSRCWRQTTGIVRSKQLLHGVVKERRHKPPDHFFELLLSRGDLLRSGVSQRGPK